MRILLIVSEAFPVRSGVARVADRLKRGLAVRGHQVEVLVRRDIPYYERGETRLSSLLLELPSLRAHLRDYDVIHVHGPAPTFSDVFLLWGVQGMQPARPKLVYTHHAPVDPCGFPVRLLASVYNALHERLARRADHVVATTPAYGRRLARYVPMDKLSVIPWGVDYQQFFAPVEKPGPFTVVYLGQIRPYKGLPVLLRACAGLDDLRLWVIGNGHYAPSCRELASKLRLTDVTFWGRLPDSEMISLLRRGHVLVLPSVTCSEAFGLALLEGMAAGCVAVASHLLGVADVVGHEGLTFPTGSVKALRQILVRLRDDEAMRAGLARVAQAKARLFSWDRTVRGYELIFSNLLGQASLTVEPTPFKASLQSDADLIELDERHPELVAWR